MSRLQRSSGLTCLIAALLAVSPVANGAPARRHKPKRTAPAADSAPAPRDDAGGPGQREDPSPAAADSTTIAPADPEASAPELPAAARPIDEAVDEPAPRKLRPARKPAPSAPNALRIEVDGDGEGPGVDAGRREAARLAAGRIEVAMSAGVDVGRRHFTYSDPIGASPRPYLLPIVPLASFGLEAYPLASTDVPFLRDLGFRGRYSRAFALGSSTNDGVPIDTSWTRFAGEVRERVLVRGAYPLELGLAAGVDASYFGMSTKGDVGALVPEARTLSLRFGADGRILMSRRLSLMVGAAYLSTTSRGEIYDHFRRPRVAGVDGDLGCAVALMPGLEARFSARYTRYFASFDPEVGDAAVAGGALDEQMQAGVGLRYAH